MNKPTKTTLSSIEKCLDDIARLAEQLQPAELPNTIRQRAKAIINRIFTPETIIEVNVSNLKRELQLIDDLKNQYKNFNFYILLNYAHDYPEEIEKLYKYSLGQMELVTADEHEAIQIEQQKKAEGDFRVIDALLSPKKRRVTVIKSKGDNGNTSVTKTTQYLDSSKSGLNGEPNPFAYRDQGRYGSHSLHDDYTDEANP